MSNTVAIIPAGGTGKRMKQSFPKQYTMLEGMPVLAHTIITFQHSSVVDSIFLVVPADDLDFVGHQIVQKYAFSKVKKILEGGKERQDSVRNGIEAVTDDYEIVIIHDGVRPLCTENLVKASVKQAKEEGAVSLGVPVKDTIKSIDEYGRVMKTIDRDSLWLTQTPQAFRREIIKKAYKKAYEENYYGTDDACLVERIGVTVKMIQGSYQNIKITTQEDLLFAAMLIRSRPL